jgi:hypothetical protein
VAAVSGALAVPEKLETFERHGLACSRRILPWLMDGMPLAAWTAGTERGCVVFTAGLSPIPMYHTVEINGVPWFAWDLGRHTPRPVSEWDTEPLEDRCFYLDGVPCYYDGSSLQAFELLQRVVTAGTEDVLWSELAVYFRLWVMREGE